MQRARIIVQGGLGEALPGFQAPVEIKINTALLLLILNTQHPRVEIGSRDFGLAPPQEVLGLTS